MVLSKNEQIALYIVIFVVIGVAGFFIFLLPEQKKIDPNKESLAVKEKELEDWEAKLGIDAFERVEKEILDSYEAGKIASEDFYNEEMIHYEADRLLQQILEEAGVRDLDNMRISTLSPYAQSMRFFKPEEMIYDIKDKATLGTAAIFVGGSYVDLPEEGDEIQLQELEEMTFDLMILLMEYQTREGALQWYQEQMRQILSGESEMSAIIVNRAMAAYLSNDTETLVSQNLRVNIELNEAEKDRLSMHVFNLDKATYILNMRPELLDPTMEMRPTDKVPYIIDIMFMIVEPMAEPTGEMAYKSKFSWRQSSTA